MKGLSPQRLGQPTPLLALGVILLSASIGPAGYAQDFPRHERRVLEKLPSSVWSVCFSKDGKWLATSSFKAVRVWDTATWKEVVTLKDFGAQVGSVAFSPDGKTLATSGFMEPARLYETSNWKCRLRLRPLFLLQYSADGKKLVTGEAGSVVALWDPAEGAELDTFRWPDPPLARVALSPDGRSVAGGGYGTAALYDLKSKKVRANLEGHGQAAVKTVAFSPDGKTLLTADEGLPGKCKAFLWDAATGRRKRELDLHGAKLAMVHAAAFSPDGKSLAMVGFDPFVHLFDVATGKEWGLLKSVETEYGCVAFSPDGRTIVTGCSDGTCKVWDVPRREKGAPAALDHEANPAERNAPLAIQPNGQGCVVLGRRRRPVDGGPAGQRLY